MDFKGNIRFLTTLFFSVSFAFLSGQSAPEIECVPSDFGNPLISWTEATDVCPSFTLYVSINGGPFNPLSSFSSGTTTSYRHVGADGTSNSLGYQFVCDSDPSVVSDTIYNSKMLLPEIERVSIVGPNQVQLNWKQGISPGTEIYRVYELISGSLTPTPRSGDIVGINNTTYTHTYPSAVSNPVSYLVTASNSCGGNENFIGAKYHTSVFQTLNVNRCDAAMTINWSPYIGWNDTLDYYNIIIDDQDPSTADTFQVSANDTNYTATGFTDGNQINVKVEAVSKSGLISTSNDTTFLADIVNPASYVHLPSVSVMPNGQVELKFYCDPLADIRAFEIYRGTDTSSIGKIATEKVPLPFNVSPLDLPGRLLPYAVYMDNDPNILTDKLSYHYYVTALDSCNQTFQSNTAQTILLQGNASSDYKNELEWSSYPFLGNGLSGYEVKRRDDSDSTFYSVMNTSINQYNDDIEAETRNPATRDEDGIFCYQVEAQTLPSDTDRLHLLDSIAISSNMLCLAQWPPFLTGIPNAFTPNGDQLNDTFKPKMVFLTDDGYQMQIYDRWGQKIFETNDPNIGWDGTFQGNPMAPGMFVYVIRFRIPDTTDPSRVLAKEVRDRLILIR